MPIGSCADEQFRRFHSDYFRLCLITRGHGVFLLNGERCYLREHTLFCLNRSDKIELLAGWQLQAVSVSFAPEFMNVNLSWKVVEDGEYPALVQRFDFPTFHLFLKRNLLYNGILPLSDVLSQRVGQTLSRVHQQLTVQPDGMWSCRARAELFYLFELLSHFSAQFLEGAPPGEDMTTAVLHEIHLNISKPLRLSYICEKYHISHTTLNRHFKKYTGFTVNDYILEKRILLAKYALAFTQLSIAEIAENYGFYDATYFIKIFKKRTGTTPAQFRKTALDARPKKSQASMQEAYHRSMGEAQTSGQ